MSILSDIPFVGKLIDDYGEKLVVKGIEKLTGVDLSKTELTAEDKQKIMDSQIEILKIDFDKLKLEIESKLEEKRIALDKDKAILGDKQRASNREIEVVKATGKKDYALYILAGIIVVAFFMSIIVLMRTNLDKTSGVYELLLILFGALGTKFSTVVDYFFGSSNQ